MASTDNEPTTHIEDGRDSADRAHNDYVGQPHDAAVENKIAEAEATAAEMVTDEKPRGVLGRPFNRKSPFWIGMMATAGVAFTYAIIQLFLLAGSVLILIGLALFLAVGMEPAVSFLVKHKVPRWAGVVIVLVVILGAIGGFLGVSIPAVVTQVEQLVKALPTYVKQLNDHSSFLGKLNQQYGIEQKVQSFLSSSSSAIFTGLLGAGEVVFSALADSLIVLVLTIYFLADMPRIRALGYRLIPHSRRPRAILIGDDILAKVGGYVLGNLIVSVIAGLLTFAWLIIFHVPYAVLLSILVAILDLIPVIGSTVAGIIVALVALTVSLPICIATIAFFIAYRFGEDYLLVPRIIGKAVEVPAMVTVVATLIGGALLGILGALVAIPIAAAILLLLREVALPRLDRT
jgi:predicted PurR-regulated permease PerM